MAKPNSAYEIKLLKAVRNGSIRKLQELLVLLRFELVKFDDRLFDYYLILEALDDDQIDIAKLLVRNGFRVYNPFKSISERTVLHAVLSDSSSDIFYYRVTRVTFITELLKKGASLDILALDEENKTPFHLAIQENCFAVTELFLSQPQLHIKAFDEKYLLHCALVYGCSKVVLQLITKGLSLTQKDETGSTPFCVALRGKDFNILDCLLSHLSVKKIDSNNYDDVAPVYVASICGNLSFIKEYADYGLPINNPLKLSSDTWLCLKDYSGFTLLHLAVKYIKLKVVEFLLSVNSDILAQNDSSSSPLHIAFETKLIGCWKTLEEFNDNESIIDLILKVNTKFESNPINKQGLSHFHIACSRNDPTVVEHFLKLGAPVNEPVECEDHNYKQFSSLHFAVKFGSEKIVEILLKNGADVKQRNSEGKTALHIAVKKSCLNAVNLLLQYGADIASLDSQGNTPVHLAFESNNYEVIDLLLSVPNVAASNPTNSKGISHFHIACTRKNVKVVKSFIESGASINTCITGLSQNSDFSHLNGYSPLHLAVSNNRATIVQLLLRFGANVEIKDHKGHIPLHVACLYTYQMSGEFIKITLYNLAKHGKIALTKKPLTDKEHFKEASGPIEKINWSSNRVQHMKVIDLLLSNGSDVNCIDNTGNTPVFYAYDGGTKIKSFLANGLNCSVALWHRILEDLSEELYKRRRLILNSLMKLDVNLDKCCEKGSILHGIISNSDKQSKEMIEIFLKKGVDINATDNAGLTPLHQVILTGNENFVKILLENGADVDCLHPSDNSTPLLTAASTMAPWSDCEIIEILINNKADVNARRSDGSSALHIVVSQSIHSPYCNSVIASLIKAGADVNGRDNNGITALHLACRNLCEETMKVLLQFGADINVEDSCKRTVACYLREGCIDSINQAFWVMDHTEDNSAEVMRVFELYLVKLDIIGLTVSKKVRSTISKFSRLSKDEQLKFNGQCKNEVKILQDPKIFSINKCTLYNVIFKNENSMSQFVKNPAFIAIAQSNSIETKFPIYGNFILLKYWEGVHRANLLPTAKVYLDSLVGMHLPEVCAENIFKYFNNVELRKTIDVLQRMIDLEIEISDNNMQLRSHNTRKRQKVN